MQHVETVSDNFEILSRATENLAFIEEFVANNDDIENAEFTSKIKRLKERIADKSLYVAIVGEFNAGKTSFINALLRDDLLESAAVVSTRTETHIKYGKGYGVTAKGNAKSVRAKIDATSPVEAQRSAKQFLNDLKSSKSGRDCELIVINHPAKLLIDNIVIVDTPGLNTDTSGHEDITLDVVSNRSDVIIVVMPADKPLPRSMVTFLNGPFNHFLHRTVFVMTKMWRLSSTEQDAVMQDVSKRLKQHIGLDTPVVFKAAPKLVVDAVNGATVDEDWLDKFTQLERYLVRRLQWEKTLAIAESTLRLTNEVFIYLGEYLDERLDSHKARQRLVKTKVVEDIQSFSKLHKQRILSRLDAYEAANESGLRRYFAAIKESSITNITNTIYAANTSAELQKVLSPDGAVADLIKQIATYPDGVHEFYVAFKRGTEELFKGDIVNNYKKAFSDIRSLGSNNDLVLPELSVNELTAISPLSIVSEVNVSGGFEITDNVGQIVVGAAAIVGTILTGGLLGVALGAAGALGGLGLADKYFTKRNADKKNAAIEKVTSAVNLELQKIEVTEINRLHDAFTKMKTTISAKIDKITQDYETALASIRRLEARRSRRLEEQETEINQTIQDLKARAVALSSQLSRLKSITYKEETNG